ncbi:hypothetical protein LIER_29735 [Lithospermum erythrorhizon]|uniref:Uncharacterized protein n=1 Tax=Lithospermum erythrorhizon TaxID=34254 RepID=A0AAV3RKC4_LITER
MDAESFEEGAMKIVSLDHVLSGLHTLMLRQMQHFFLPKHMVVLLAGDWARCKKAVVSVLRGEPIMQLSVTLDFEVGSTSSSNDNSKDNEVMLELSLGLEPYKATTIIPNNNSSAN